MSAKEYPGSWHRHKDGRRISGVYIGIFGDMCPENEMNMHYFKKTQPSAESE